MHPALTPAIQAGTSFTYPRGMVNLKNSGTHNLVLDVEGMNGNPGTSVILGDQIRSMVQTIIRYITVQM